MSLKSKKINGKKRKNEILKKGYDRLISYSNKFNKCMKGRIAFFDSDEQFQRKKGFWCHVRVIPSLPSEPIMTFPHNPSEKELDLE